MGAGEERDNYKYAYCNYLRFHLQEFIQPSVEGYINKDFTFHMFKKFINVDRTFFFLKSALHKYQIVSR